MLDWFRQHAVPMPKTCLVCGSNEDYCRLQSPFGLAILCQECDGPALFLVTECWHESFLQEHDPETVAEIERLLPGLLEKFK